MRDGSEFEQQMCGFLAAFLTVFSMAMQNAQAQLLTVYPDSIIPLPDTFEMAPPALDLPPEIARFQRHGSAPEALSSIMPGLVPPARP